MKIRKKGPSFWVDCRVDGKRIQRSLRTADRTTAKLRAEKIVNGLRSQPALDRASLDEFVKQYLAWSEARKPRSTWLNEKSVLKRLAAFLPCAQLSRIGVHDTESFITSLLKGGVTNAGANFYLRTLRSIFARALDWQMVRENPFRGVKLLRVDIQAPRILKRSEITEIFSAAREVAPEYAEAFAFYLTTGLRRTEATELAWEDIDFDAGVLTVKRAKGRRYRLVPLTGVARRILAGRQKKFDRPFPFRPEDVSDAFRRSADAAGVPDVTLHDLRRTYGTMLASAGVNALLIQTWLGHSDDQVTRDYYIGMPEGMQKRIDGVFSRGKNITKNITTKRTEVRRGRSRRVKRKAV